MAKVRAINNGRDRMLRPSMQDQRLEQGNCPNDCGPLDWVNPYHARCIRDGCDFTWKPNVAFGGTRLNRK